SLTLANTLWLLSLHPEIEARLREELAPLEGELPLERLDSLPLLDAVLKETLRLRPPAWIVAREADQTCQLGPYAVEKGTQIYMSQYLLQRDPRWFSEPERFLPDRWLDGSCDTLPRFAYFPFGGGPRICIGNHFALMELKIVLVTLLQHARFTHRAGHEVEFRPSVTLRPTNGMPMRIEKLEHAGHSVATAHGA
ncbi:MAG: cytochrome P450, partial [Myxococcota bacterium]